MIINVKYSSVATLVLATQQSTDSAILNQSSLNNNIALFEESGLCGFSGLSFRHFMNNMGKIKGINYLEVGTYCGSTLLSFLAYNLPNINSAYAVDNWSWNTEGSHPKDTFFKNLNYFFPDEVQQLKVIEHDCFSIDKSLISEKINFYFYDGPHSEDDHYRAFTYYDSVLADCFVTAIDDWNSPTVQLGTSRAFKDLGYEVVSSWEIDTSDLENWSVAPDANWHCGTYIAVVQKNNLKLKGE